MAEPAGRYAAELRQRLGPGSPALERCAGRLHELLAAAWPEMPPPDAAPSDYAADDDGGPGSAGNPVAAAYLYWRRYALMTPGAAPPDAARFVRHTCLSLLCRMVVYRRMAPADAAPELWPVLSGDYFTAAGLGNFLEEDFFGWPFINLYMGLPPEPAHPALEAAQGLWDAVAQADFPPAPAAADAAAADVLIDLYYALSGDARPRPTRPQLEAALRLWATPAATSSPELSSSASPLPGQSPPGQSPPGATAPPISRPSLPTEMGWPGASLLDPFCGPGELLAAALRQRLAAIAGAGGHPAEELPALARQFMGMTTDPIALTVARSVWALTLGETLRQPHPPALVPVYLGRPLPLPPRELSADGEPLYRLPAGPGVPLPERVALDPHYADWLLGRLYNYLKGAWFRSTMQPRQEAEDAALLAWYNYLVSPKRSTPAPQPLTPAQAEVMVELARRLMDGFLRGSWTPPLFAARNAPAPLFAAHSGYDCLMTAGVPGGAAKSGGGELPEYLRQCGEQYLRPGRTAITLPDDGGSPSRFTYNGGGGWTPG